MEPLWPARLVDADTNDEDAAQILAVQRTLGSPVPRASAALAPMERPLWQFQRYLADRLGVAS